MAQVKMAILGCGGMAGGHARRFAQHPDVEIVALCDVNQEIVEGFIERNLKDYAPQPRIFTDPAQMYAQAKPDAVTIVTPHTAHFEHGMQAIENGCHVLMEKPMVTDSNDAHQLAAAVEKSGKVFVVGYNTPCTPAFEFLREVIRSGEMGTLELVSGWLVQDWKRATVGKWRQDPALSGGGQMYDSGAHLFNSLVWTVEQPVDAVQAFVDNQETAVDINGTVNIRFKNGVMATITIGGNCAAYGAAMCYAFTEGRIEIDGWSGTWVKKFTREGEVPVTLEAQSTTANDNFIDAILGRAAPRTSPINGVNQSELMDAIYESARTGQIAKPTRN